MKNTIYNFNLSEYKNLVGELGHDWRLRNELRFQLQIKKKEILSLQDKFAVQEIKRVRFLIRSFILNQEKGLLTKLFEKEDFRVSKFK